MRIAWFTPYSPQSAIGHYSEVINTHLAQEHDVTVFATAGKGLPAPRQSNVRTVALHADQVPALAPKLKDYDICVYNLGNHLYNHLPIYEMAGLHPGIVILHDLVLQDFFRGYCLIHKNEPRLFEQLMRYAHGPEGELYAKERLAGLHDNPQGEALRLQYPLFQPAIRNAEAIIVHSRFAAERITPTTCIPVRMIDFPILGPTTKYANTLPPPKNHNRHPIQILTFGELNSNKAIHLTIAAIGKHADIRQRVHFTIIGSGSKEYQKQLESLIREYQLESCVTLAGYRSDDELATTLFQSDICVNLRNPHLGESSASLLNSLVAGLPTIVWNHGFYAEFPDDVVLKVQSEQDLVAALKKLTQHGDLRRTIGSNARTHALQRFNLNSYCKKFSTLCDTVQAQRPLLHLTNTVTSILQEFGTNSLDHCTDRFASELSLLYGSHNSAAVEPVASETTRRAA